MELALYLKNLLYNNDEVIIPGLGTLLAKYKPAEVDPGEKIISPPMKFIVFDETKTEPGTMLYEYYALSNPANQQNAVCAITKMVSDIHQKLDKSETVFLEGIGYFSKIEGSVRFEKIQDYNYLTDAYGLSKVSFEYIKPSFTPHVADHQAYVPHRSHTTLYLFILLLVAVGGGIFLYLNYPDFAGFISRKNQNKAISPIKPIIAAKTKTDTLKNDSTLEKFFDSATDKKNALAISDSIADANSSVRYYIIAGSFKTLEKASQLSKEIETEGYKNEIVHFDGTTYRISLGTYTNKAKAIEDLLKIRFTKGDDAVWLLTKK